MTIWHGKIQRKNCASVWMGWFLTPFLSSFNGVSWAGFCQVTGDGARSLASQQSCSWSQLASCCDAAHNFIASQNNTPLGSNMSYEVDNKKTIHITEDIFRMLPEPLDYPFKNCAVVGNGGILKNSSCGAEIDKSDFVFRCNLPPTMGSISQDVGNKTNLVTVNPSIIKLTFLENIASYGEAFLLLPAFSFRSNTAASFKVHQTLKEFSAKQEAIFFYPRYLRNLAQFWRTKGVKAYRLSSGFMITSAAVELCENVKLYGFWPFSKSIEGTPISHHYYDNQLPKPGFHAMPKEYSQILQLHGRGILKLQFGKCLTD
uniref:ST8 alpha-N-acetyl-neuraminide alpha-2,8-sialyltransferase 6 n=1 Tax=Podarcis muralis TaxID=64176 RepID=A0A670IW59_PODMU